MSAIRLLLEQSRAWFGRKIRRNPTLVPECAANIFTFVSKRITKPHINRPMRTDDVEDLLDVLSKSFIACDRSSKVTHLLLPGDRLCDAA